MQVMIRSMASTSTNSSSAVSGSRSTTFLPPVDTVPDISNFQSLLGSSTGSLSWQPMLPAHTVDGAISNMTIVYPRDLRVTAPSHSSSLQHKTSMMDLDEEFKSASWRPRDVQPQLGFRLGLAVAIVGEGSLVTALSGLTLQCSIIIIPSPSAICVGGSHAWPIHLEFAASVLDDTFFSSGARSWWMVHLPSFILYRCNDTGHWSYWVIGLWNGGPNQRVDYSECRCTII